tara:strand:+ start:13271 stop:13780 length:510 start_codon:yes stop_codon:yes gene_type:complete
MKSIHFLLLLTISTLFACSGNKEQRDFENEAYRSPSNITYTNIQGEITNTDPDDWRISPFYQGLVEIQPTYSPPYPNPAQLGSNLNFEISVTGVQPVNGLDIQIRFDDNTWRNIYSSFDNPLPIGLSTFQIDPLTLGQFNTPESAKGLHRIFLFDFNQRLISYGDILVE